MMIISFSYYIEWSICMTIWFVAFVISFQNDDLRKRNRIGVGDLVWSQKTTLFACMIKLISILTTFPYYVYYIDNCERTQSILNSIFIWIILYSLSKSLMSCVKTQHWTMLYSTDLEENMSLRSNLSIFELKMQFEFVPQCFIAFVTFILLAIFPFSIIRCIIILVFLWLISSMSKMVKEISDLQCKAVAKKNGMCWFMLIWVCF